MAQDQELDVNGRACSIEFDFGQDCSRDDSGSLMPVEWGGRSSPCNDYQGALRDTRLVQQKIMTMLGASTGPQDVSAEPWRTVFQLAQAVVDAARPSSFPGREFRPSGDPEA